MLFHCRFSKIFCLAFSFKAMNFISYVAEFSREWGEPNARDMGRMTSQPKAKGEIYILNDVMDMKAKIAAMERRLEELEMNQMQEVQAISRHHCKLCFECPIIPVARDMFGDCNTYNSSWRNHPNFSWKPRPPPYQPQAQTQAPQQTSWEQAIVNLSKVMGDFVGEQKEINSQLHQKIENVESSQIKRMDEVDLPTCKLEHKEESETEKEKREEIKGKKNGKSTEEDGYDVNVQGAPQRIVIKEEMMKNHIPPPFLQALYGMQTSYGIRAS
ncbi:hypothetical protein AAG906_004423 [Vitis piasezkii]